MDFLSKNNIVARRAKIKKTSSEPVVTTTLNLNLIEVEIYYPALS